ncbi:uncharacterized protein JCM6883_004716 [Sporobolomyces salmoneus]|uniref:uncharacterized protein n=1 Tax=Sporobolomyces salmoneus TaxID=183962 RepID=UPI00317E5FFB
MRLSIPLLAATLATLATALPSQQQITFSSPTNSAVTAQSLLSDLDLIALSSLPTDDLAQLEKHILSLPEKRKVQLSADSKPIEITEGEKALLTFANKHFVDVTDDNLASNAVAVQGKHSFPSKLSYSKKALSSVFDKISTKEMKTFLTSFSGFRTRYYRSDDGKQSQNFLLGQISQIANSNKDLKIKIREFPHSWGQNSILVRFEPTAKNASDEIVIIGAHQDSTNLLPFLGAPGADDDGSGTTSILEAFRVLVASGFQPSHHPVEFHWNSAEEGGLLGSKAIAQDYQAKGIKVKAYHQNDMTAWVKQRTKPTIGLIRDFVDPAFTDFLAKVIDEYSTIGWTSTKCGYACSDHASWSTIGAPSAFTIESTFEDSNHNIHSGKDTIEYSKEFSFDHMAEFTRVAIGTVVELSGGDSVVKSRE